LNTHQDYILTSYLPKCLRRTKAYLWRNDRKQVYIKYTALDFVLRAFFIS
jgi:hypothetical protein